jgi:hypothetical protein
VNLTSRNINSKSFDKSEKEFKMNLAGAGKGVFIVEVSEDLMLEALKIVV